MADIFLSYARPDIDIADGVCRELQAEGYTIFFDQNISVGERWDALIETEINQAQCVVVLWSSISRNREWVRREARHGANRKVLCPALIDACEIPLEFSDIQTADLRNWTQGNRTHREWRRLVSAVSQFCGPFSGEKTIAANANEVALSASNAGSKMQIDEFQPMYDKIESVETRSALRMLIEELPQIAGVTIKYETSGSKERLAIYRGEKKPCTALAQKNWLKWFFRKPALENSNISFKQVKSVLPEAEMNNSGEITVRVSNPNQVEHILNLVSTIG